MATPDNLDGILITWGDRLFYPGNRVVKVKPSPRLTGDAARQRAAVIRQRIAATVVRRVPPLHHVTPTTSRLATPSDTKMMSA